jgi:chorismate dehydratase
MKIAVWKNPVTYPVFKGLSDTFGKNVFLATREQLTADLQNGKVQVALMPSDVALANPEEFDIIPAVAVSTWNNPYALLTVGAELGSKSIGIIHSVEGRLTALLAAIVLKEHYGTEAALNERISLPDEIASDALISIPLEESPEALKAEAITLDLGQEWYELSNYPFVWAVFVTRKGEATPGVITAIRDAMVFLDDHRADFASQWSKDEEVEDFVLNDLRLRLDDMAVASLTELCDHMFFHGVTPEIQPVVFASLPLNDGEVFTD